MRTRGSIEPTPRPRQRPFGGGLGLTLIELLIAAFILVVVLGLGGAFLSQQTSLQRAVQARNDVQDRVRVVLQIVTQDFSLAGNSVLSTPGGGLFAQNPGLCRNLSAPNEDRSCIELETVGDEDVGERYSSVSLRYLSSQFPAGEECRDVTYQAVPDGDLLRSDVECEAATNLVPFATNVEVFTVVVRCSDGATRLSAFDGPTGCPGGYPRSAVITFASRSEIPVGSAANQDMTYLAANGERETVACEAGFVCFLQSQEILMPNLKDR